MIEPMIFTGAHRIRIVQLLSVKAAIKLEMGGMKHSRGSVSARWARHFGMPPRTSKAKVLKRVVEEIEKYEVKIRKESGGDSDPPATPPVRHTPDDSDG